MQLIIDGGDAEGRGQAILSRFPQGTTSYITITKDKTSIPVAAIRELITSLATSTNITRVVVIEEANTLTPASQNTLLKVLEEPPSKTHFVLSLDNYRELLPTILSRCEIEHLGHSEAVVDSELLSNLKATMQLGPAGRLSYSGKIGKDREEVSTWFGKLLDSLSVTLKSTTNQKGLILLGDIATLATAALAGLSQNGNVTLVRDHFFLSLPKTK